MRCTTRGMFGFTLLLIVTGLTNIGFADTLGYVLDTSGGSQHVDSNPTTPGARNDYYAQEFTLNTTVNVSSVSVEGQVGNNLTVWLLSGPVGSGTPADVLEEETFNPGGTISPEVLSLTSPLSLSAGTYQIVVSSPDGCCSTRIYQAVPALGVPSALPSPSWGGIGQGFECITDSTGFCDTSFAPGGSWGPQLTGLDGVVNLADLDFQVEGTPVGSSPVPEPSTLALWLSGISAAGIKRWFRARKL